MKLVYLAKKNSSFARFARAFIIFVHFAHFLVLSTTWIALFCSYVNDDNTWCHDVMSAPTAVKALSSLIAPAKGPKLSIEMDKVRNETQVK